MRQEAGPQEKDLLQIIYVIVTAQTAPTPGIGMEPMI